METSRLTELRKEHRLTQAEFAKVLGIAPTTYASYEQGRREPADEIKKQIAEYFNVTTDYLLGFSDKRTSGDKNTPTDVSDMSNILTFEGREIPDEDRELINRLLRGGRND